MIRDTRKPYEYFSDYIDRKYARIVSFQNMLPDVAADKEKTKQVHLYLANFHLDLIYGQYSCGVEVEIIKETFLDYLTHLQELDNISYIDTLNTLSLAVLFDVSALPWESFTETDGFTQYFMAHLKNQPTEPPSTQRFPDFSAPFVQSITENDANVLLKHTEHHWYDSCQDLAWYDNHNSKQNTYKGYWSFITGAIIKINRFDKGIFAESIYTPLDFL